MASWPRDICPVGGWKGNVGGKHRAGIGLCGYFGPIETRTEYFFPDPQNLYSGLKYSQPHSVIDRPL